MPHIHERMDFTVEVFVVHAGRVLLRLHDKYGLWLSVGGHVELDEDPNQAARREVREEVGLDVTLVGGGDSQSGDGCQGERPDYQELIPPRFLNRHRISPTHEHVCLTYFAVSATDDVQAGGPDRSDSWRWLTRAQVASDPDLEPHIRRYALAALETISGITPIGEETR